MRKWVFTVALIICSSLCAQPNSASNTTQSKPLYIGLDADLSALAAEGGLAIKHGALIAIEEINAAGGLLGRPVELIIRDHRGNPARGLKNIDYFAQQEDFLAVLGGVHTPVALAELPAIHEHKLIYLGPWAAGTPIIDNGYEPNYVFRVSVRDAEAAKVMMAHARKTGIKSVALMLERTGWGRSNEKSLLAAARENGISVQYIGWFNWHQNNFDDDFNKVRIAKAQALMLVANAPEGAAIAKSMLSNNLDLPIISHWGIAGGNFVQRLGTDKLAQLNVAVLQTFNFAHQSHTEAKQLASQYFSRFATPLERSSKHVKGVVGMAHAYDLVHLLAKATTQANSTNRADIRVELENITTHHGAVKTYHAPFTPSKHDALLSDDYFMTQYDKTGNLVPIKH